MKPLTTSVYTFSTLREGGFLYVDKTAAIHALIRREGQYFLSRPRRFGKSLLISTLKAIFQGRRELFAGLAVADTDYDWRTYPVIHLDMGTCAAASAEQTTRAIFEIVDETAAEHGVALANASLAGRFRELVQQLSDRDGKVVILVDEYDKPLLGHLGDPVAAGEIQKILKQFYAVVKATEPHQRFVQLTGVSKFSKVSVFSDLNNLTDLTMHPAGATLLGYTQAELEANFPDYIARLAQQQGVDRPTILAQLREWYNGYRFHAAGETVYNPVSVMKCFDTREFRNYWFETGTPTFLVDLLKRQPLDLGDLTVPESAFSAYDPARLDPLPLLFQTGYLTIRDSEEDDLGRYYRLAYPNREIGQSFSWQLATAFTGAADSDVGPALRRMAAALRQGDIDTMLTEMNLFFADVPYDITLKNEKYYQTIFFVVFRLLGASVEAEVRTNRGRVDAVIKTDTAIILFEFKLHDTAESALAQMRDRAYHERFMADGRPVTLVGAAFSPATRDLQDWLVEPLLAGGAAAGRRAANRSDSTDQATTQETAS